MKLVSCGSYDPANDSRKILYRYEQVDWATGVDEFDNILPGIGETTIQCREFRVDRESDHSYWISDEHWHGKPKVIRKHAHRRYAWETKKEALVSLIKRKRAQLKILKNQRIRAEVALGLAEKELKNELTSA